MLKGANLKGRLRIQKKPSGKGKAFFVFFLGDDYCILFTNFFT
jgi:hypothetical protein